MNLQEELMQLTESYYTNRYNDWLNKHQNLINGIKEHAKRMANKGLFTANISLFLDDDSVVNLKKWLEVTGLIYSFTLTGVGEYDLCISWDVSKKI